MSVSIDFGDGTDSDSWNRVFQGLVGAVCRYDTHDGYSWDAVLDDIGHDDDGQIVFFIQQWSDELDEPVGELLPISEDRLKSILYY